MDSPRKPEESPSAARILVVHTGGIGDFLLACPSIQRLAEQGPVTLLGRKERLELAVAGRIAEEAHDLGAVGFESLFSEPNDRLRTFLSPFTRAVVWMKDDDGLIQSGLKACGIPDLRVEPGLPPNNWQQHASTYYTARLGMPEMPPLRLALDAKPPARDVIIHAGSGSPTKNWPLENFLAVASWLKERGRSVSWCLGPAERESPPFKAWKPSDDEELLPACSLVGLAGILANTALYIGNDGGITHLAAAVDCTTIALFGPTDPLIWGPLGENVVILRDAPWPSVETVLSVLEGD